MRASIMPATRSGRALRSFQHALLVLSCFLPRLKSSFIVVNMVEIKGDLPDQHTTVFAVDVPGALDHPDVLSAVPPNLQRATARLSFPPSYAVVGVYRLATDRTLFVPVWEKCRHGAVRGAGVALVWVRSWF